jgi:hypothetical protein
MTNRKKLEYIAITPELRKFFSPMVQGVLTQAADLHPIARTPAKMAELLDEWNFHATSEDIGKAEEISTDGPRWQVVRADGSLKRNCGGGEMRFHLRALAEANACKVFGETVADVAAA